MYVYIYMFKSLLHRMLLHCFGRGRVSVKINLFLHLLTVWYWNGGLSILSTINYKKILWGEFLHFMEPIYIINYINGYISIYNFFVCLAKFVHIKCVLHVLLYHNCNNRQINHYKCALEDSLLWDVKHLKIFYCISSLWDFFF